MSGSHAVYPGTFDRVTVLVAVNADKHPTATQEQRLVSLRAGVRNHADLRHECRLAGMNEDLGVTTLLIPVRPGLAGVSSTAVRALGAGR